MQQDVRRISRRVRVTKVQPEVRAEAVALESDGSAIGQEDAREPVVRTLDDPLRGRVITAVKVEDVVRIRRRSQRCARGEVRILVPYRADDDEGMNLDSVGVRFSDQILQRIEARSDGDEVWWWLERVEIPGVAAPPHLREDRVRIGRFGVVHDCYNVTVVVERGVEGVYPKSSVLADALRRCACWIQRQPD